MKQQMYYLIKDLGFPIVVAMLLLYDKMKTNGSMMKVIDQNNLILKDIKDFMIKKL